MSIVYFLGSVQGIILSVLLFSSTKNVIANRLLGILTFMWAIALFAFGLSLQGIIAEYPHLLRTVSHVEFTLFPLLFLNVNYLLKKHEKFRRKDLLHFIPFIFIILLFIPFYRETAETKYILVSTNSGYYYYLNIISDEILSLQGIIYSILALIMIRKYNRSIVDYESNIDKVLLKYYRLGIYVLLAAWIFGTVAVNLNLMYIEVNFNLFIFTYLLIVFVIYMASYAAIKSDEIYKLSDEQILHSSNNPLIKTASLKGTDESYKLELKLEKFNNQLLNYMEQLKRMEYDHVTGYIWYAMLDKIILVEMTWFTRGEMKEGWMPIVIILKENLEQGSRKSPSMQGLPVPTGMAPVGPEGVPIAIMMLLLHLTMIRVNPLKNRFPVAWSFIRSATAKRPVTWPIFSPTQILMQTWPF
jgi:Ca2+/Na+ antiporter